MSVANDLAKVLRDVEELEASTQMTKKYAEENGALCDAVFALKQRIAELEAELEQVKGRAA